MYVQLRQIPHWFSNLVADTILILIVAYCIYGVIKNLILLFRKPRVRYDISVKGSKFTISKFEDDRLVGVKDIDANS